MIVLCEPAYAKINLYLHVLGKRADNYHLLDSLVAFADVADRLEVIPSGEISLRVKGCDSSRLPPEDNSVLKAANALRAYAGIKTGAALTLYKNLPIAAGLGGGSADAAAALRLLTRFWNLKTEDDALRTIALDLGADVPACLRSATLYMGGIGERLEPGPNLSGTHLVLVHPGKALATREVFLKRRGNFSMAMRHPDSFASLADALRFLGTTRNDLEASAIALVPQIADVIAALARQAKCLLARMSGSGATCFGLFACAQEAQEAAQALSAEHSAWWVTPAKLLQGGSTPGHNEAAV